MTDKIRPWKTSLHGGHSGEFCDHADGSLAEILEAAVARGCSVYGVSEHAPRVSGDLLYDEERAMGYTVETLLQIFDAYAVRLDELVGHFRGKLTILRGFESEVVPTDRYVEVMLGLREQYNFDYMVGSVHHVAGFIIDYRADHFEAAQAACGGLEGLAVRYYETYASMVRNLRPEVAAHFDLVRRNAPGDAEVATPRAREAAFAALEAVRDADCILDINTGGYRKGLGRPYPAPWVLAEARRLGIPVCFGDDAHRPSEVASHFDEARQYLLDHGYTAITALEPSATGLQRREIVL
jgi:histidinol-phosphatase (PHP family)